MTFTDIIGLRYQFRGTDPATGVDCLWASRRALERIFPDLEAHEVPVSHEDQAAALARARQGIEPRWTRVGGNAFAARELGDLVISQRDDGSAGASVLIDVDRREVITAMPELGVIVQPIRKITRISDVFRRSRA